MKALGIQAKRRTIDARRVYREGLENVYCSNYLVTGVDVDSVRRILKSLGDSIVVARAGEVVRIHIHAKWPRDVEELLNKAGKVLSKRVEPIW